MIRRWLQTALAPLLGSAWYFAGLFASYALFTFVVLYYYNNKLRDFQALGVIISGSLLGAVLGHLAGALRLRTRWVLLWMCFLVALGTGVAVLFDYYPALKPRTPFGSDTVPMMAVWLMLLWTQTWPGYSAAREGSALSAAFGPGMLTSGALLMLIQKLKHVDSWFEGAKHAIWSWSSGAILVGFVAWYLIFSVIHQRVQLSRWTQAPEAPAEAKQRKISGGGWGLSGCGSVIGLVLLAITLSASTAVVSPYLWRTGPGDRHSDESPSGKNKANANGDTPQHADQGEPDPGDGDGGTDGEPQPGEGPPDPNQVIEQLQRQAGPAAGAACAVMTLAVLALAGLLLFGPPVRRAFLLAHLRRADVGPSESVRRSWRMVQLALGDAGLSPAPGDDAHALAVRARSRFDGLEHELLCDAAKVADRVAFGFGIGARDTDLAARAAEMAYASVWDRLSEYEKLLANYRWL